MRLEQPTPTTGFEYCATIRGVEYVVWYCDEEQTLLLENASGLTAEEKRDLFEQATRLLPSPAPTGEIQEAITAFIGHMLPVGEYNVTQLGNAYFTITIPAGDGCYTYHSCSEEWYYN